MLKRLYLRDVGGHITASGQRVRTGLLYRASGLNPLRRDERVQLAALNVQHIIDLREAKARQRAPDLFRTKDFTHLPITLGAFETIRYRDILLQRVAWPTLAHPRLYADILEENGAYLRQFLELAVAAQPPLLIHCAAGKDRTGVFVSVLLLALGVPPPEVVNDYMAIQPHLDQYFPSALRWVLRKTNVPALAYSVIPSFMEEMINHLVEKYSGIENYMRVIGFAKPTQLRAKFLEG